jgi:hypothetical protein
VLTALQRDPDHRWQNAAAMGRALRAVAEEVGRVDPKELLRWVQWAFTREPWSESGVGRILATLESERPSGARIPAAREREAPPTLPAIPATYEDAPPTMAVSKSENTQLTKRAQARWTRILVVMLAMLGALVAYAAWAGKL